ncbi:hypothetical protein ABZ545_24590 [Streptomyces abikoensis]
MSPGAPDRLLTHVSGDRAGRIAFGDTPVRFPLTTAVVRCYADAKE